MTGATLDFLSVHQRLRAEMRDLRRHGALIAAKMLVVEPDPDYPEWQELTIGDALLKVPYAHEELVKTWLRFGSAENPLVIDQWRRIRDLRAGEKDLIANNLLRFSKGVL